MITSRPLILALGEILWDLLPDGTKQLGGAPANFAYHAHGLGAHAQIVSAVGNDALGSELLSRLELLHVDRTLLTVDQKHPTGTVSVALGAQGQPEYIIHSGVAWDFIPLTSQLVAAAARADALCFGTLGQRSDVSRKTLRRAIAGGRPDALRICDINFRQAFFDRDGVDESLRICNVLKLNEDELPILARLLDLGGPADEIGLLRSLITRYNLRLVAFTRGQRGSTLLTSSTLSECPAESVTVADTIGAGDAFTAAMVVGLLKGLDIELLHRQASRLAAYVCTQPGGTPRLPPEVLASLARV